MNPEVSRETLSRRDFLKLSGTGLLGLMLPPMEMEVAREELESVTVDFEFVNHSKDVDIAGVRPKIEKSDLIVIENIGWDKEELDFFNRVSIGEVSAEEILETKYSSYYIQLLNELSGTNKKVVFADVPKYSNLETEWFAVRDNYLDFSKPFTKQLRDLYIGFRMYSDWQRRREDESIKLLLKEIRQFKNKQENKLLATNVLVVYGASHTRMMHIIKKNTESGFSFPDKNFVYSYEYEAKRRFWFADDESDPKKVAYPDEDLMARVVLEKIVCNWFYYPNEKYFKNTSDLDKWVRGVVSMFDTEEIKAIWDKRRGELKEDDPQSRFPTKEMAIEIAAMMREKGVEEKYILAGLNQV